MRFANQYINPALAFAFIIFVALGYMLSLIFPTTISVWDILLILSLIVGLGIAFVFIKPQQTDKPVSPIGTIVALLPYLIFLPGLWILLTSPELQISYHGDLHTGYVNQLLYHTGQPDNSYLPGTPASYYWLFHTLIATLSHISGLAHPIVRSILGFILLLCLFGWVHRVVVLVIPEEYPPIVHSMLTVFVLFGMNLFASLQSMVGLWDDFNIWRLWEIIAPVSFSDIRLETLYVKFFSYSSFPLVLLYSWIMIYVAIKLVKQSATTFDVSLFILGFAGGTAFLLFGGVLMLGTLSVAIAATWLVLYVKGILKREDITAQLRVSKGYDAIPLLISLLGLACILIYAYNTIVAYASSSTDHHLNIIPSLSSLDNATLIFGALYPLTLFLLLGFYIAWKESDALLLFLSFALMTIMYGALILESSDTYKLILLGSAFATLITARVVNRLLILVQNRESPLRLGIALIIGMYLLCALNIITFTGGTLAVNNKHWQETRGYDYRDGVLERGTEPYGDVYAWLRENTTADTWLIMRPDDTDNASLLAYRLPYVSDVYLTPIYANLPEWGVRASLLYTLMNEALDTEEWQSAWETLQAKLGEQAVVYIFPNDAASSTIDLETFGFERLFEGEYASVYRYLP